MTGKPDETRPGKPDTTKTAKRERRKLTLEEIPFVREVPVVASATMVVLRYVGAWLRGGDEESGGFGVRLLALGAAGYIALYFAEKHPGSGTPTAARASSSSRPSPSAPACRPAEP